VETADRGGAPKLLPLPEATEDGAAHGLIFTSTDAPPPPVRARRVRSEPSEDVFARIDAAPAPTFAAAPPPELTAEERDAALEDIIQQIIADPNAGALPALQMHRDFLVRCRIKRLGPNLPDAHTFRRRMTIARARATALDNADDLKWTRAIEISDRLPDDMRGPFLMLARAAVTENVCPTDDEIARFFGSHSPGRARRLLSNMEATGILVVRTDYQGCRIVAFPELEVETTAVHPKLAQQQDAGAV
jgi:hypothetical protein